MKRNSKYNSLNPFILRCLHGKLLIKPMQLNESPSGIKKKTIQKMVNEHTLNANWRSRKVESTSEPLS